MRSGPLLRAAAFALSVGATTFLADAARAPLAWAGPTKAPPTPAADSPKDKARALAQEGIKAFESGNPQKAIDLLNQAEALFHAPVHGLFMARANAAMGKLVEAKTFYKKVSEEQLDPTAPPAWVSAQEAARKEVDDADRRVPRIVLTIAPADAQDLVVTMNDEPLPSPSAGPIEVNPGTYKFVATSKAGGATATVEAKERATVDVKLALGVSKPAVGITRDDGAPRAPSPIRFVGLGAVGLGGAAVIAGAVLGGLSGKKRGDANKAFDACEVKYGKNQCQGAEEANVKSLDKSATTMGNAGIGLIAGGAAVATAGVVLYVVGRGSGPSHEEPAKTGRVTVEPVLGLGYVGAAGTF